MKSKQVTFDDVTALVKRLIADIEASDWEPAIIVGIARGGLLPAVLLSHHFDCPMQPLCWSSKFEGSNESNLWLPEDAMNGTKTLIVDDIVDTGNTISEIMEDWESSVFKPLDWNTDIKIACLHQRDTSDYKAHYVGEELTSSDYQIYPWEQINAK